MRQSLQCPKCKSRVYADTAYGDSGTAVWLACRCGWRGRPDEQEIKPAAVVASQAKRRKYPAVRKSPPIGVYSKGGQAERIAELLRAGTGVRETARITGASKVTVTRHKKLLGSKGGSISEKESAEEVMGRCS